MALMTSGNLSALTGSNSPVSGHSTEISPESESITNRLQPACCSNCLRVAPLAPIKTAILSLGTLGRFWRIGNRKATSSKIPR